ncbi:hypothetical protein QUC32_21535 [Novosphingobium resinovorum]|uniref:hypothetical protein n=1 Tax=Sphingomonadaceae TaxID=41297 RepID=UPI00155F0314|nr:MULTISPECIES: hypothetical protein [Sphingomonadaceae]MBF7012232.1 hypothetical protein [Novosphingobium sp. HR1a]WJM26977.1 hypothetical protein QUC32_21535 [Novosphingobium resinovorum]
MSDLQAVEATVAERGVPNRGTRGKGRGRAQKDWTIKGLSPETVEVAREAAKSSGMKINAWVSQALTDAACDVPRDREFDYDDRHHDVAKSEIEKLRARNDELIQTVNTLSALLAKSYLNT